MSRGVPCCEADHISGLRTRVTARQSSQVSRLPKFNLMESKNEYDQVVFSLCVAGANGWLCHDIYARKLIARRWYRHLGHDGGRVPKFGLFGSGRCQLPGN